MKQNKYFKIRNVELSDYENLAVFFKKAYGSNTIFQSKIFLEWYFNTKLTDSIFMKECLVGVTQKGEIVSHYGGLNYSLLLSSKTIYPIVWGVNAYTFPEWRGLGINTKIVETLIENNEINAVIGFTLKTAKFYESINYNIFNYERFSRFYRIIDAAKTEEVIRFIGQEPQKIILKPTETSAAEIRNSHIIQLEKENISRYNFHFNVPVMATTNRTYEFITWRFFDNPIINYYILGFAEGKTISSYIVCRAEQLEPFCHKALKIVDLFGNPSHVEMLLSAIIAKSVNENFIYIDFSVFGTLYNDIFEKLSFGVLCNDNFAVLPQTCAPISKRDNNEYIGLQSKKHKHLIAGLTKENVYFTRMDSDRDRAANISQLNRSVANE